MLYTQLVITGSQRTRAYGARGMPAIRWVCMFLCQKQNDNRENRRKGALDRASCGLKSQLSSFEHSCLIFGNWGASNLFHMCHSHSTYRMITFRVRNLQC